MLVEVGENGVSDIGEVLEKSALGRGLEDGGLHLPSPPDDGLQYVLLGDGSFPLKNRLMRPYPERGMTGANRHKRQVYNCRLSRARRAVKVALGVLVTKWRIFQQVINADSQTIDAIVKGTTVLHNFLRRRDAMSTDSLSYISPDDVDVEYGDQLQTDTCSTESEAAGALQCSGELDSDDAPRDAIAVRERFVDYFVSPEGALSQQDQALYRDELGVLE